MNLEMNDAQQQSTQHRPRSGNFYVEKSFRWGASPTKNGKYLNQIPSEGMRKFNQWLRGLRVPLPGWRFADAGHIHWKR
jgi:hypothetical protein